MLNDPGIWNFLFRIIHYRIALVIVAVQYLCLEPDRAVLQSTQPIAVIFINHPCKDRLIRNVRVLLPKCKIICIRPNFRTFQHPLCDRCISADGDSLVSVVEIIIIIREPDRQTADDKGRQLPAVSAPLLLRVALYQLLEYIPAHQGQALLLQILRIRNTRLLNLLRNHFLRLLWGTNPPHLAEGIHIERQVIQLVLIHRNG